MKNIILIGAGGHCRSCIDVIELENKFKIIGLIDKNKNQKINKYKVLASDKRLKEILKKTKHALITLGQIKDLNKREKMFNLVKKKGFKFPSIISPLAYVSHKAKVGEGTIIMHGAIVNSGAIIGKNCIVNSKSLVEHDAIVGNNSHLSTRSTLNGGVTLGKNCFVGSHAIIKQGVRVGKNTFINANLFIDKNIKYNSKIYEKN